ncbi:MAG: AgmX/PglI C-terminal domain-containing protein [Colwellia sp.]|nr:AgmX/PglI C-terminal domain-containing protein [Colwellia sp.]
MTTLDLDTNNNVNDELCSSEQQDIIFSKILTFLLAVYIVFGLIVPFLERIEVTREVQEKISPQLAKVILKKKQLPPPEKIKEQAKPDDIKVEKPDKTIQPPKTKRAIAKQKAQSAGLAAMKDELFAMRDAFIIPSKNAPLVKGNNEEVKVKRKLLTSKASKQSKSLRVANVTKMVQSDDLSGKKTQTIRLAAEEVLVNTTDDTTKLESSANKRSEVTLRRTLEQSKSRLYALYNRALRKDPFLKGKVLFEIKIQPDGIVSQVVITSSQLNNKKLERQLTLILKSIRFSAEEVSLMTTIWAIEFLPS